MPAKTFLHSLRSPMAPTRAGQVHSRCVAGFSISSLFRPAALAATLVVSAPVLASVTTDVIGTWSGECVSYARSRVPSLPYGLNTLADKKRIMNSSSCKKGSVAIIDASSWGHVAYVENCDSSGSTQGITIVEANYKPGKITRRKSQVSGSISKAQQELRILGYFRP